jgi:dUTP pyrophosphatase
MPLGSLPTWIAGDSGSFADGDSDWPKTAGAVTTSASSSAAVRRCDSAIAYAAAMRLKIKRLDSTVPLPTYGTNEAAGFDLAASQDVRVAPGQIALVPTGLVIEVPSGHFLAIFARSSTPLKRGLMVANGVGVLDPDYCGPNDEVKIQVLNISGAEVQVKRGDRLAQGVVLPASRVSWQEVNELREVTRGGFGATGV